MKKNIADYFYKIIEGRLFIHDLNLGNISLTNSIEVVLKEIESKEKLDYKNLEIIQIDSEGEFFRVLWDGQNVGWRPIEPETLIRYKELFK
jgi:hypothetical protein